MDKQYFEENLQIHLIENKLCVSSNTRNRQRTEFSYIIFKHIPNRIYTSIKLTIFENK